MFACWSILHIHRVTIEALHSRYLWRIGRVFNLSPLFFLDLNHSDQWNTLLSAGGEIFQLTNLATPLGNSCVSVVLIFLILQLLSESYPSSLINTSLWPWLRGRTLKVLLCCWIDPWPKIIWREHRELESEALGMRIWFHGDACQH